MTYFWFFLCSNIFFSRIQQSIFFYVFVFMVLLSSLSGRDQFNPPNFVIFGRFHETFGNTIKKIHLEKLQGATRRLIKIQKNVKNIFEKKNYSKIELSLYFHIIHRGHVHVWYENRSSKNQVQICKFLGKNAKFRNI